MDLHPPALPWWSPHLSLLSSVIGTCFWLVVVCNFIDRRLPKVTVYFLFKFFLRQICRLQQLDAALPHVSNQHAPPLKHPFYRGRQLLVDCYLLPINSGHLRPTHHILSIFGCCLFRCPKWEPASMASNNQAPCACPGSIGIGGTNRRCCRGCCHGDRGQSTWG
jgi:hypothetical protein